MPTPGILEVLEDLEEDRILRKSITGDLKDIVRDHDGDIGYEETISRIFELIRRRVQQLSMDVANNTAKESVVDHPSLVVDDE